MTPLRATYIVLALGLMPIAAAAAPAARDSIPNAVTITEPIEVGGKIFTVREVVQRAMKGERSKLAGHRDATYKITGHVAIVWPDKKTVETSVYSIYGDSTGFMRRVLLASQTQQFKKKNDEWVFDED